jgi:dienelactone hydrolase
MSRLASALAAVLLMTGVQAGAQTAQTDSSPVIVKGIRNKPPEDIAPPPLDVFTQSPRIERIALSTDGSRIAWITRKAGLRLLVTYNVTDGSNKTIRLSEDRISAITWLDNDHLLLSDTITGVRGTCPTGQSEDYKVGPALSTVFEQINGGGFGAARSADTPYDGITAQLLQNALTPPPCRRYGVRSRDAATIVDLRTSQAISLGSRISGDYNQQPLGLPKPVMIDGKMQLVGAFLELRDKSIAGQAAQRVYPWRVDPDTGVGRIINDGGGDLDRMGNYVDDWFFDDAGKPTVRALYDYFEATFSIELRKDGKWSPVLKRKIDQKAHTFAPFLAGRGRDGVSLLLVDATDGPDGGRRFRYHELSADGQMSEALDEDATRDRPIFDPETGALAGFARDGELTTYTFFDEGLAEYYKHAVDTAPGQAVRIVATARDPGKMIVFEQGGEDPGSWHYFDFTTGKRVDIGSQHPAVPAEWVASQRSITYTASDGLAITAQLTLPPQGKAKDRALVVLPHDGPLRHDARGFDWLAQALASRGYVVLQPNYRGSDGGSQALTEAGYGQWSGRMLSDLSDGVAYLSGQGIVDPKRVCIAGRGYGGYAALRGAQDKAHYRCAIAINGISNPGDYADNAAGMAVADEIAALKADVEQDRGFRADVHSPALIRRYFGNQAPAAVTDAAVPVLLVQADEDRLVPSGQGRALRDRLQRAGKSVVYAELDDCDRNLSTESCRLATAEAVVAFLTASNPAK